MSEDFTIYIEEQIIYLDLQASGFEVGPFTDSAFVYLDLQPSGSEIHHIQAASDATTVYLTLTPGATWETQGHETPDVATALLKLSVLGGECYSRFHFSGEGEAYTRWSALPGFPRWSSDPETRWGATVSIQPGCH